MKTTAQWCCALALASCIPLLHAAQAVQASPADTQAAKEARATRDELAEKQKQIFEEKNIPVDAPSKRSSAPIDLPLDETDAPGAVQK